MGYYLGVDLGTTFTAAAVQRGNRAEIVSLDQPTMVMPSIVFARSDGTLITGSTADRRGRSEPDRVAREFKRRLGDSTAIILGGSPFSAEALMAALLKSVVHNVTEVEGEPPAATCVTCPASWGAYRRELFTQVLQLAGIPQALVLTEPEAAATYYASSRLLPAEAKIAVYDLGGGTFDATVLQRSEQGIEVLGTPEGLEHLGGMDFDEAIFHPCSQPARWPAGSARPRERRRPRRRMAPAPRMRTGKRGPIQRDCRRDPRRSARHAHRNPPDPR